MLQILLHKLQALFNFSIDEDDNIYVGKIAKERKILYPDMTADVFKRSMGTNKEFV